MCVYLCVCAHTCGWVHPNFGLCVSVSVCQCSIKWIWNINVTWQRHLSHHSSVPPSVNILCLTDREYFVYGTSALTSTSRNTSSASVNGHTEIRVVCSSNTIPIYGGLEGVCLFSIWLRYIVIRADCVAMIGCIHCTDTVVTLCLHGLSPNHF